MNDRPLAVRLLKDIENNTELLARISVAQNPALRLSLSTSNLRAPLEEDPPPPPPPPVQSTICCAMPRGFDFSTSGFDFSASGF